MLSLSEVLSEMSFFGKDGIQASLKLQESTASILNQKVTFCKLLVWPSVWAYIKCVEYRFILLLIAHAFLLPMTSRVHSRPIQSFLPQYYQ
jgi:hypothetical protein